MTIFTAACTTRSRTAGIDNGRCSSRAGLGDVHPPGRQRPIPPLPKIRGQLVEQPGHPVLARRRRWWFGRCPMRRRCGAPAPTPAPRRPCGGPCHRARGTVVRGRPWPPGKACVAGLGPCLFAVELATRALTGPFPARERTDEAAALPSPAVVLSVRLKQYYDRLRRPPGCVTHFPVSPVIGRDAPTALRSRRAGEGLPSSRRHLPNVPRPLRRGVLRGCTPGSSPLPWPSP